MAGVVPFKFLAVRRKKRIQRMKSDHHSGQQEMLLILIYTHIAGDPVVGADRTLRSLPATVHSERSPTGQVRLPSALTRPPTLQPKTAVPRANTNHVKSSAAVQNIHHVLVSYALSRQICKADFPCISLHHAEAALYRALLIRTRENHFRRRSEASLRYFK